jgi:hypothetical protein
METNGDIAESCLTDEEKIKWQTLRWKNRRRMAWFSVYSLIAIILLLFFAPIDVERLKVIADPVAMISFVFGGIIGAYMGFTTIEKYKMGK